MAVWLKTGGFCWYCGKPLVHDECHIDHVIPRASEGGNDIDNLVPCCKPCNSSKHSRSVEEYRVYLLRKALFKATGIMLTSNEAYGAFVRFCAINAKHFDLPTHLFYFETRRL